MVQFHIAEWTPVHNALKEGKKLKSMLELFDDCLIAST